MGGMYFMAPLNYTVFRERTLLSQVYEQEIEAGGQWPTTSVSLTLKTLRGCRKLAARSLPPVPPRTVDLLLFAAPRYKAIKKGHTRA